MERRESEVDDVFYEAAVAGALVWSTCGRREGRGGMEPGCCHCLLGGGFVWELLICGIEGLEDGGFGYLQ